ncbi:hypothetical protein LshimejAT787_3000190 [Lyophyllum shimeji]|uniref:Uncharacterized protein n=1 Tax=Lyophyllum shimeji TaxID=47721 RepID=A0A9P3PZB1_LYOSH|nr:hypothetical protein LshimejAT787_3000190 [Lyophyllum shimeji]
MWARSEFYLYEALFDSHPATNVLSTTITPANTGAIPSPTSVSSHPLAIAHTNPIASIHPRHALHTAPVLLEPHLHGEVLESNEEPIEAGDAKYDPAKMVDEGGVVCAGGDFKEEPGEEKRKERGHGTA